MLERLRQLRRKSWRELLDGCVGHDASQYAALHGMPMVDVLPRIERWIDEIKRLEDQAKAVRRSRR